MFNFNVVRPRLVWLVLGLLVAECVSKFSVTMLLAISDSFPVKSLQSSAHFITLTLEISLKTMTFPEAPSAQCMTHFKRDGVEPWLRDKLVAIIVFQCVTLIRPRNKKWACRMDLLSPVTDTARSDWLLFTSPLTPSVLYLPNFEKKLRSYFIHFRKNVQRNHYGNIVHCIFPHFSLIFKLNSFSVAKVETE